MQRRELLKHCAAGIAATSAVGTASALPEVHPPEVENACGPYGGQPDPDESFEVYGGWTTFTFDPTTHTYSNYYHNGNVSGNMVFTSVEFDQNQFTVGGDVERARRRVEVEGNTLEARTRSRKDDARERIRSFSSNCENSRLEIQLREANVVTYWLASGYSIEQLDANSVLIYRDDAEEPIVARIDGGEGAQMFAANATRIIFGGEGDVTFNVVTAADQVPEMECTPVLDSPCPE